MKRLGQCLREAREELDLGDINFEAWAKKWGKENFLLWESGEKLPSWKALKELSEVLRIPYSVLEFLRAEEQNREEEPIRVYAVRGYCKHCFGKSLKGACYDGGYFWIIDADEVEVGLDGQTRASFPGNRLTLKQAHALLKMFDVKWICGGETHKDVFEIINLETNEVIV